MHHKNAVIIGAGVAGLASAIRLAVQGYNVQVHERNTYPGGKLNAFEKEGFHFDTGPSLFTQPENIEELFELAGEPIDKYFSYQRLDVACKYFFENGKGPCAAWVKAPTLPTPRVNSGCDSLPNGSRTNQESPTQIPAF